MLAWIIVDGKVINISLREKCLNTGVFSPYFPVFGLNMESYAVNLQIQSKYRKIRSKKTPYLDTFHAVYSITTIIN